MAYGEGKRSDTKIIAQQNILPYQEDILRAKFTTIHRLLHFYLYLCECTILFHTLQ